MADLAQRLPRTQHGLREERLAASNEEIATQMAELKNIQSSQANFDKFGYDILSTINSLINKVDAANNHLSAIGQNVDCGVGYLKHIASYWPVRQQDKGAGGFVVLSPNQQPKAVLFLARGVHSSSLKLNEKDEMASLLIKSGFSDITSIAKVAPDRARTAGHKIHDKVQSEMAKLKWDGDVPDIDSFDSVYDFALQLLD